MAKAIQRSNPVQPMGLRRGSVFGSAPADLDGGCGAVDGWFRGTLGAAFGATDRRRRGHAGLVLEAGVRVGELGIAQQLTNLCGGRFGPAVGVTGRGWARAPLRWALCALSVDVAHSASHLPGRLA